MATEASASQPVDLTSVVAKHYNQLEEKGLDERSKSRIFHMRNFNNWIKSMLIGQYLEKARNNSTNRGKIHVLDMGAGKGGDLLKWKKANIQHLVCADIAETSVEQCQQRYTEMTARDRRQRYHYTNTFSLECIAADCTKVRLKDRYKDTNQKFDIVSSQFSFHYCFESLSQAQCMIRNASECLKPGGFFIGTTPNAIELVRRLKESDSLSFGNDIFSATFDSKEELPLFGAQYAFHLEGVVDCPEFLVYFPAFVELASQVGLKLVCKKRFDEFFEEFNTNDDAIQLLMRMQALQPYPTRLECEKQKELEERLLKEAEEAKAKLELKEESTESMDSGDDKSKDAKSEESSEDIQKKSSNDTPKEADNAEAIDSNNSAAKESSNGNNEGMKDDPIEKSGGLAEFKHADKFLADQRLKDAEENVKRDIKYPYRLGTLSQQEWDAISIYVVFAFVKEDPLKKELP